MATNLNRILRYLVVDAQTKQTIAGFATSSSARWFIEDLELRTGRDYEVKDTRG